MIYFIPRNYNENCTRIISGFIYNMFISIILIYKSNYLEEVWYQTGLIYDAFGLKLNFDFNLEYGRSTGKIHIDQGLKSDYE